MSNSREVEKEDRLMIWCYKCYKCCFDLFLLLLFCCQGTTLGDGCIVDPSVLTSFLGGKDFEDLAWPMVFLKIFGCQFHSWQTVFKCVFFLERYIIFLHWCKTDHDCFSSLGLYFTRKMPGCMHITINSRSTIGLNLSMGIWHKHTVQADTRHIGT